MLLNNEQLKYSARLIPMFFASCLFSSCLSPVTERYVDTEQVASLSVPDKPSIQVRLDGFINGSLLIFDNGEKIGVFGSNDKHQIEKSTMSWNLMSGIHLIEAKYALLTHCYVWDIECLNKSDVAINQVPTYEINPIKIIVKDTISHKRCTVILKGGLFKTPEFRVDSEETQTLSCFAQ